VLAFFFVLRFFPELAGRTLEDIETSLREGTFRPGGFPSGTKARKRRPPDLSREVQVPFMPQAG